MSYPLGANYHVPHGESNYAMFTGVMKRYMTIKSDGEIARLNAFIASILGCDADRVYDELENLLNVILPKKALHEYGVKEDELAEFAKSVMENQGRLMAHNSFLCLMTMFTKSIKNSINGIKNVMLLKGHHIFFV